MRKAIVNCRLFDGEQEHVGLAVIVEDGQIVDIVDEKVAESLADEAVDCDGLQLVPGFIDLQVNGGGGVLFNDAPTVDTPRTMQDMLAAAGENRIAFNDLRVRSATLEDVFLKLTGRRIRN